jgi:hypothetical protein
VVIYTNLSPGAHQVKITGTINAASGSWEDNTPAVATFTVTNADTTPPNTTLLSGPRRGEAVAATSVVLSYSADEPRSTFECTYDPGSLLDALWSPCTTPQTWSGLSQGSRWFAVRAQGRGQ